jgi:hypothetical protein
LRPIAASWISPDSVVAGGVRAEEDSSAVVVEERGQAFLVVRPCSVAIRCVWLIVLGWMVSHPKFCNVGLIAWTDENRSGFVGLLKIDWLSLQF